MDPKVLNIVSHGNAMRDLIKINIDCVIHPELLDFSNSGRSLLFVEFGHDHLTEICRSIVLPIRPVPSIAKRLRAKVEKGLLHGIRIAGRPDLQCHLEVSFLHRVHLCGPGHLLQRKINAYLLQIRLDHDAAQLKTRVTVGRIEKGGRKPVGITRFLQKLLCFFRIETALEKLRVVP